MKSAIRRKFDELGRIVVPIEIRKSLHYEDRQLVEMYSSDNVICIEKADENMYKTGMCRRIDELGRIVIPAEIRETFDIEDKNTVEIYLHNNVICLKPVRKHCVFCGEEDNNHLVPFRGKHVCGQCRVQLHTAQISAQLVR